MGKTLFRFRSINKNSISALMNDFVFASTPDQFNDPYDVLFSYDPGKLYSLIVEDQTLFSIVSEIFCDEFKKEKPSFTIEEAQEVVRDKLFMLGWVNNTFLRTLSILRRQILIVCFCESVSKEIMWSHYANYGEGFALEYDEAELQHAVDEYIANYKKDNPKDYLEKEYQPFGLKKVDYSRTRIDGTEVIFDKIKEILIEQKGYKQGHLSVKKYALEPEDFDHFVAYKDRSWEYENEVRLVLPNHDSSRSFCRVFSLKPLAIYVGEFIGFNDLYTLCSIAKTKKITIYKMVSSLDKKKFGLKKRVITEQEIDSIINRFTNINFYD